MKTHLQQLYLKEIYLILEKHYNSYAARSYKSYAISGTSAI